MEYENALIAAGETVLRENRFPSAEELSLVTSNAATGHDLMLLGLATECARSLRDTHKALSQLQTMIIHPGLMAALTFDQKIVLTRTLMDLGKYQHGILKDARERVDVQRLQTDVLMNDDKVKPTDGMTKETKTVIRQRLMQTVETMRRFTPDDGAETADAVEV